MLNKPDLGSQSNINATSAESLGKQYIHPLARSGVRRSAMAYRISVCLFWLQNRFYSLVGVSIPVFFLVNSSRLLGTELALETLRSSLACTVNFLLETHCRFRVIHFLGATARYPGLDSGLRMARVLCMSVATLELCATEKADPEIDRGKRTRRTTVSLRPIKMASYPKLLPPSRLIRWRGKLGSFRRGLGEVYFAS